MSKYLSNTLQAVTPNPGGAAAGQKYIKLNTNESLLHRPPQRAGRREPGPRWKSSASTPTPPVPTCSRPAAKHFGLQPDQIMPGNGSDENLFFALRAFCDESHPLAYADITYGCYGVWCGLLHIPSDIVP